MWDVRMCDTRRILRATLAGGFSSGLDSVVQQKTKEIASVCGIRIPPCLFLESSLFVRHALGGIMGWKPTESPNKFPRVFSK